MSLKKIIRKNIEDNAVTEPKLANEAVTAEKITTDFITGLTELTSVADNDNLLISDTSAGVLKKVSKANTTTLATPTFSSVSPDNSQTVDGGNITFTITGTGFTTGTNARLIGASGQRLNFDSVTRSSTTSITAVIARSSLLLAQSPYGIQVINGEGLAVTAASQISIDTVPIFNTSAGSLGTFTEGDSIDIEVSAYDPDSTSDITFELQSGSLPAGLSLVNQSGDSCRIQGTASAVSADTTSNFTLRATDSASNTTSRSFSITIEDFILNGLRFDDGSSDYLSRTNTGAGNRRTFTYSFWYKRGVLGSDQRVIEASTDSSGNYIDALEFTGDTIRIVSYHAPTQYELITTQVFRDPSAWYHIVVAYDTTQATDSNRLKLYVNGSQVTLFSTATYPAQNFDLYFNNNSDEVYIGRRIDGGGSPSGEYLDGYLSQVHLIDGSQLTPSSFGETDSNGIWVPKNYSGSFGTNGFHLDFADSADLGNDVSGNNNDFTENNITSIDKVEDTPQNNYVTWNPLDKHASSTLSEGNLKLATSGTSQYEPAKCTIGFSDGKWYSEHQINSLSSTACFIGIYGTSVSGQSQSEMDTLRFSYNVKNGEIIKNASNLQTGLATFTTNDILGIEVDCVNGTIKFYKNGSQVGTTITDSDISSTEWTFGTQPRLATFTSNFGNPAFTITSGNSDGNGYGNFEYAVPSGYYALNTKNLAQYG